MAAGLSRSRVQVPAPGTCQVLTRPIIIGRSGIVVARVGVDASVAIVIAGTILDGCV